MRAKVGECFNMRTGTTNSRPSRLISFTKSSTTFSSRTLVTSHARETGFGGGCVVVLRMKPLLLEERLLTSW